MPLCVVIFSAAYLLNILGEFLNVITWFTLLVLELILYLCGLFLSIPMSIFRSFPTSEITWGCASGVSAFFFNYHFWQSFIFGVAVKFLLLIGRNKTISFLGSMVGVPMGIPIQ